MLCHVIRGQPVPCRDWQSCPGENVHLIRRCCSGRHSDLYRRTLTSHGNKQNLSLSLMYRGRRLNSHIFLSQRIFSNILFRSTLRTTDDKMKMWKNQAVQLWHTWTSKWDAFFCLMSEVLVTDRCLSRGQSFSETYKKPWLKHSWRLPMALGTLTFDPRFSNREIKEKKG